MNDQEATVKETLDFLRGSVERVTYHSDSTGFAVIQVKARGVRGPVAVVGTLPDVASGEIVEARGRWVIDPKHGRQFKAMELRTLRPDTLEGMRRYLGSGMIRGIGPHFAEKLVAAFGLKVFDVIEKTPRRLLNVPGIGKVRCEGLAAAWAEQAAVREIMVFLQSHGVSTSRAFRIFKTYGALAIETVSEDPYRLARDIRGIGFKTADQIAERLGIPTDSPLRATAGVEWVLQELTGDGHCAFPKDSLVERSVKLLEIDPPGIREALERLAASERTVEREGPSGEMLVYLSALDYAERMLVRILRDLASVRHPCPSVDLSKALEWYQKRTGITLAPAQRDAVEAALTSKVLLITGGPGVGKTTLVDAILRIQGAKGVSPVLCAPTGRAAKRLTEATGLKAKTIHRLLAFDPKTGGFKHDEESPLRGDLFVVDEASMLDIVLSHQLVRAIPKKAALILVGDVDQLPSVGPGCVLRDCIDSGVLTVRRLTEVFRQAARSAIVSNAHRINGGLMPRFPERDSSEESDCYFVEAQDPGRGAELVLKLVRESIPRKFGLDPVRDIQVLSPMRRGDLGARNLNLLLQEALNGTGPSVQRFGWTYRLGDKVMQIENDYEKEVFNGDLGLIRSVDTVEQRVSVSFDGREVAYAFGELDELLPAYATTVHKAQGSEYPAVVVPVHTQHYVMLQRNLLYTAVTRARKLCVIVGTERALAIAVKRVQAAGRVTTLKERLRTAFQSVPGGRDRL